MSNIDQAFINAYADQSSATMLPPRSNYTVREPGPTLRVFTQPPDREQEERRIDRPKQHVANLHRPHSVHSSPAAYAEVEFKTKAEPAHAEELTLPSLVAERKPLSAFTEPKIAPVAAFKPVYEVDEFRWPAIADELVGASTRLFAPVVELLLAAASGGRSLIGIGGATARVGTSTVTMCLARLVAAAGKTVALVDGNFVDGNLAQSLGLEFGHGWEDVLIGKMPLAECAVASLADKMTLIPLGGPAEVEVDRLSSIQSSVIAGMLRYHHDVVLFDLGAASDPTQLAATRTLVEQCRIDAGITVATAGAEDPVTVHGVEQLNAVFGSSFLGIVGNRAT